MPSPGERGPIEGYDKGFTVSPKTGERSKREYSVYMEEAEDQLRIARQLRDEIEVLRRKPIPERAGVSPETMEEMSQALEDLTGLIQDRMANEQVTAEFRERAKRVARQLRQAEEKFGIPELRARIREATLEAQSLILTDKLETKGLKSLSDEELADTNV